MRVLIASLVAVLLAAGCVSPGGVVEEPAPGADGTSSGPAPGPAPKPAGSPPNETAAEDEPTFCESESGCDFWDDDYHEYVLYEVDTYVVDVLIVPSASADTLDDTSVITAAVEAWATGIQELGAPWFTANFTINTYVLGQDVPPAAALQDPEIIVLAAEYNPALLFGIGLQLPMEVPCRGAATQTYAPHAHDGMTIHSAKCEQGGLTCLAVNTNFLLGSPVYLQDLVAHEFGHCLAGGHVGDALDFKAKRVPVHDIMSYQHDEEQAHCVSNLNVRVLEAVYAPLMGVTVEQPVRAGDYYAMAPADYAQVACENP
jgi:hypothetical protein